MRPLSGASLRRFETRRTTPRMVAVALSAVLLVAGVQGGGMGAAFADDAPAPSEADVAQAEANVEAKGRDVAQVQADLVRATIALDEAGILASQAAEAYNGALWAADQARAEARAARTAAKVADARLDTQRDLYARALVADYQGGAQLQGLTGLVEAEGIGSLIDRTVTMANTSSALDSQHDSFQAAATIADAAMGRASSSAAQSQEAAQQAVAARDQAASAEAAASARAAEIAATRSALLSELADLQGISVSLADKRQRALETAAAIAAAKAAERERRLKEKEDRESKPTPTPTPTPTPSATPTPTPQPTKTPKPSPSATPAPTPTQTSTPTPTPTPAPTPTPTSTPTPTPIPPVVPPVPIPAPGSGAQAAIAFAETQVGKPYKYGASGPDAWDCSGLTSAAWAAGGKSLPHYSVAQYTGSTAISAGQLQPGDLVFWGSSNSPSSIYHVALYVGGGQIIHAPRTGRDVTKESMYYWRAPNFFARP